MRSTLTGRLTLFCALEFAGLSFLVIGWRTNIPGVMAFGGTFILLTLLAFRSSIPFRVVAIATSGMLIGTLGGGLCGSLLGTIVDQAVGIIGGAMVGLIGGVAWGVFFVDVAVGPIAPHLAAHFFLRLASGVFLLLGLIGAIIGTIYLSEVYVKVFGAIGGGAVIGGTIVMALCGMLGVRQETRHATRC
jgi:hypothetical protein